MTKEEFRSRVSRAYRDNVAFDQLWSDIEAERGVVIDWDIAPKGYDFYVGQFSLYHQSGLRKGEFCYPRPAPKYRPATGKEKMDAILIAYREVNGFSRDQAMYRFAVNMAEGANIDDLCKAAGIKVRVPQ